MSSPTTSAPQPANARQGERVRSGSSSKSQQAGSAAAEELQLIELLPRFALAREFSAETTAEELAYVDRRFIEEMQAGKEAESRGAKLAHFELAVPTRDLRARTRY